MTIKRILVPIDLSDASLAGLDYAVELSRAMKATLLVIFVVEMLYYAAENLGRLLVDQQRLAEADLARLAARFARRGIELEIIVETGVPAQSITDAARKRHVDLIVMTTHGRTGFSHLLMGSVAEKVVRGAPCPVLTVPTRPPKRRAARSRKP